MEYSPDRHLLYYHKELPAAERAVEAARKAGKDKECPNEFQAADKMVKDAFTTYWACRTREAIAKANEATAKANALCPKKMAAPKPAPVAAPPLPTISLMADPASIEQGKCATLNWSTSYASRASIDQRIGNVDPRGSRRVCPETTTRYTMTAIGDGGAQTASATVNVKPPPAAPKVVDRLTVHVNFDSNKADIRKADVAELQKAIVFVRKYPGYTVSVEGHTDDRGDAKYNQTLSEKRAVAVKNYLLDNGVGDGGKISTVGYGEDRPKASNKTEKGRFENRRVEILILSE
jgi:OOP family OmpA-OmpF porin